MHLVSKLFFRPNYLLPRSLQAYTINMSFFFPYVMERQDKYMLFDPKKTINNIQRIIV